MSQIKTTKDMSPMFKAFIQNSDLDYEKSAQIERKTSEFQQEQYNKAKEQLSKSGDIIQRMLETESCGVNDKSEIHPNFKNYDHSLEMDRVAECNIKRSPGKGPSSIDRNDYRPVERDGVIMMEPTVTIEELLDRS